jgi:pyridoxal phosphate enzyme (YggS family)
MSVADNLARVRERMANAASRAGRASSDVKLVGVTKYVDAAAAAELARAGCIDLGESRPQELWQKYTELETTLGSSAASDIRWHLIGHLQRNKVRRTLPLVHLIHSIDNERLLAEIDDEAKGQARPQSQSVNVLLEVNTSGEAAKHGFAAAGVEALVERCSQYANVTICGLMTMAALAGGEEAAAQSFAMLRELRDKLQPMAPPNVRLTELSMGMSGDFEIAIAEGATIVRVGSALWDKTEQI